MNRKRAHHSGVITVWLALLLSVFLAVTGALLEYARAQAVSYRLAAATVSACESIFAGYSKALLGRYHLLARFFGSDEELEDETRFYLGPEKDTGIPGADLTVYEITDAAWSDRVFMTDENGAVFREMAVRAMTDTAGGIILSDWKERLGLSDPAASSAVNENRTKDVFRPSELFKNYDSVMAEEPPDIPPETESGDGQEKITEEALGILDMLKNLKKMLSGGIMGLLVPAGKTVSAAAVPTGGLPSGLSGSVKGRHVRKSGGGGNPILFREYLMRNTTCFTAVTDAVPSYETEYLIAGKSSDDRNLKSVIVRVFMIRTACNTITIQRTPSMKAVVDETAALCMGWTGNAGLVAGMAGLLTAAWASAESVMDVRSLLSDGRIPLIKTAGEWRLSLKGLDQVLKGNAGTQDVADGLSYGDHLRLILYFMPDTVLSYRMMDVIDWNVRRISPGFTCAKCMLEGRLTVNGTGRFLFSGMYRRRTGGAGSPDFEKTGWFSLLSG